MRHTKLSAAAGLGCLVLALGVWTGPPGAVAASKHQGCTSASFRSSHPERYVDNFITKLRRAGADQSQVEAALAKDLCIVRIDSGAAARTSATTLAASSTNSAVLASPPTISYDGQVNKYYAISYWKWRNDSFTDDLNPPLPNSTKNIGGTDGFGTAFNVSLILSGYSATAYGDAPFGTWSISPAAQANSYGAGYIFQDKTHCTPVYIGSGLLGCEYELNVRQGQEVITFKKTGRCRTVYGMSKYRHTWDSTKVTGAGIGKLSVSLSTSTTSHQWPSQSQPGNTATVCSSAT